MDLTEESYDLTGKGKLRDGKGFRIFAQLTWKDAQRGRMLGWCALS